MKIYRHLSTILVAAAVALSSLTFSACDNDDDQFSTDQFTGGVSLNVFGPSPVARGGELRFIGSGLDKVTSVEIPGCSPITAITVINPAEIRCIVPQDALPGLVALNYAGGKIYTKTQLTYSEPVSISSLSPSTVRAGDILTISGEYLNLVKEVIFADGVTVAADEFISQSRSDIKVKVPSAAQSGKVIVSDGDEEMPVWIYSDIDLVVTLPSVVSPLELSAARPGDTVTVAGSDLDLVMSVTMPDGASVDFRYDDGKIVFTLPDNISDGVIMAVAPSGVEVQIAVVSVATPVITETTPTQGLRPGDIITIKGENIDMVASLSFTNVDAQVKPVSVSESTIKVVFPSAAQSGPVSINLKSGKTYVVTDLITAKPQVDDFNPNPVAAASAFTIIGKNLDLLQSVKFAPGITVNASTSYAGKIEIIAPATAESGTLTLTMKNGETVESPWLNIDSPACAFITEVLSEELNGGDLLVATVRNGEMLTGVKVNDADVQYIINGETLYVALPPTAGKNSVILLISSNGQISYLYDIKPAVTTEKVIWSGAWECSGWAGNQDLAWGGFDWSQVDAGSKLTLYTTPTVADGEWWCISLRHGMNWGSLPGNVGNQIDMPADGVASVILTADIIDDIIANGGLVVTGTGYILNKITLE